MITGIIQGALLGFVLTAIPGAVFLETTRRALERKSVLSFLGGNFVGVGMTILVTFLGLADLLKNASLSHIFYILSGSTLVYIGLTSIISKKVTKQKTKKSSGHTPLSANGRAFLAGLILAIANPVSILFWVSMIGKYLNSHDSYSQITANCVAVVIGTAFFYMLLLIVTRTTHRLMPQRIMLRLTDVFGVIIFIYGGFIISKAL